MSAQRTEANRLQRQYNEDISNRNRRIEELENESNRARQEFNRLFDTNISLERELEVYRRLLDDGENHLDTFTNLRAQGNGIVSRYSGQNVIIGEHNLDGRFIWIQNITEQVKL